VTASKASAVAKEPHPVSGVTDHQSPPAGSRRSECGRDTLANRRTGLLFSHQTGPGEAVLDGRGRRERRPASGRRGIVSTKKRYGGFAKAVGMLVLTLPTRWATPQP
jgi:hypothetical protein